MKGGGHVIMDADAYILLGVTAWLGMVLAPPAIARAVWGAASRRHRSWALHLLFPPAAIAASVGLAQVVFFAAHDDGEGPPGLGLALIPPLLVLLLTIAGYALCLTATALRFLRDRNLR